ncbi:diaminobutyrate acetyltransferase [Amphibacillus sp. Q70]|uniref:diaminobutyrate acetyltransferase n=1 Tax=Amphibacillus sp. Q70 TaxID=3453416 RepID=UPI003F8795B9
MFRKGSINIDKDIRFSRPDQADGERMWRLVNQTTLDNNSVYQYIMMTHYFVDTCVVAKLDQELVGFITGFISPQKPDTVFVWQIGVDPQHSGKGIGSRLLEQLFDQVRAKGIKYIEATITPHNKASQALFESFANQHETSCDVQSFFSKDLFPDHGQYEKELKFIVGPLNEIKKQKA